MRLLALCLLLLLCGCIDDDGPEVVAVPPPPAVAPNIQLPVELRWHNWSSVGSCVYASFCNSMECSGHHDIAVAVRQSYSGLASAQDIIAVSERFGVEYDTTFKADPGFLDWASRNGYPCVIWWKERHCCNFMGWVVSDGIIYADIIDNNFPARKERVERNRFIREWRDLYGGFALAPMCDLATVVPYPSYELVYE